MAWWHLARTPDGLHAHDIDAQVQARVAELLAAEPGRDSQDAEATAVGEVIAGNHARLGFPTEWWTRAAEGWDSSVSHGEPHEKTLAAAVAVHRP